MTIQSNPQSVEDLTRTIEELTVELLQLRLEVTELRQQSIANTRSTERSTSRSSRGRSIPSPVVDQATNYFSVGDFVEITNNRNGLRGSRGTVLAVTREQVQIDIPHLSNPIRRKFTNVRLIETAESNSSNATDREQ